MVGKMGVLCLVIQLDHPENLSKEDFSSAPQGQTAHFPHSQVPIPGCLVGIRVHTGHISYGHEQGIFAEKEIQAGWQ